MILTIDVGNTNVVMGCVEDGKIVCRSRMATNPNDLSSDYALKMRQSLEFEGIDFRSIDGAILSSVVPQLSLAIKTAVKKLTGLDCIVVGAGIKTGMNVKIDDPGTLAGDLITGAVGAAALYKPPLIVVDMGTATTVVAIDRDGAYIGGAIVPGVKLSYSALASGTSLLPNISIEAPHRHEHGGQHEVRRRFRHGGDDRRHDRPHGGRAEYARDRRCDGWAFRQHHTLLPPKDRV